VFKVLNYLSDGTVNDITALMTSLAWSSDVRQAPQQMTVGLVFSNDVYTPRYQVRNGSVVVILEDEEEVLRGVVFKAPRNHSKTVSLTAYDHAIYMAKNKTTKILNGVSVKKFITSLCSEYGIPTGSIPELSLSLTAIYRDMTLYDMIVSALTEVTKRTGEKYQVRMIKGELNIIKKSDQVLSWRIALGENLIDAQYNESIENLKNRIVIRGDNNQVLATVEDQGLIAAYGLLQEQFTEQADAGDAQTIASNYLADLGKVLQEFTVKAIGIAQLRAGDAVEIADEFLEASGVFYVDRVSHSYQNQSHTMSITLNWTNEVAEQEVEGAAIDQAIYDAAGVDNEYYASLVRTGGGRQELSDA
jgi:hypothetical protein